MTYSATKLKPFFAGPFIQEDDSVMKSSLLGLKKLPGNFNTLAWFLYFYREFPQTKNDRYHSAELLTRTDILNIVELADVARFQDEAEEIIQYFKDKLDFEALLNISTKWRYFLRHAIPIIESSEVMIRREESYTLTHRRVHEDNMTKMFRQVLSTLEKFYYYDRSIADYIDEKELTNKEILCNETTALETAPLVVELDRAMIEKTSGGCVGVIGRDVHKNCAVTITSLSRKPEKLMQLLKLGIGRTVVLDSARVTNVPISALGKNYISVKITDIQNISVKE